MGIINKDGSLYMATGIDNTGLYSGFNQAEKRIDDFEAYIKKAGNNITRLTGIGFGVAGLKEFGSELINTRGDMQLLETSFGVLLGNGAKANAMLAEIKQYNIESPLSLNGISQAAQLLLGFNVDAEKVMPTLRQLGDISMGSTERFQSLALAFAQMSAAGKLMGQDLLQMINAGFNPLQEISKNTGKSLIELRKEMENGSISSEMVAQAFASATSEGGKFYGMTEKQAQGIKGLQAKLEGGLIDAYNKVGKSQEGLIAGGYKVSIALIENYQAVGEALTALIATYGLTKAAMVFNTSIDKTVTLMRYDAEIAELTKLLPLKEQEANADLKAAVASGKLTEEKANQIIALRAEIESRRESIQSKLAEEQINLKTLEAKRLESVEAIKLAQAKTAAAKEELANAIATAEGEKVASLQKKMGIESERQSRAALRIVKLQDQKDAAIEQAIALKENSASAEKVAAKNREIASIQAKIAAAREEEIQHGRNVAAMRAEIKSGVDVTANKNIQTLTNKVNTLSEKENAAAATQTGYAKQIVGKKVLIKKLATDAETISNQINTAEQNINTTSTNFLAVAKNRAALAAKNLWAALAPNPYVLAAAAAVALGYGVYKLVTATSTQETAQKALNKVLDEAKQKKDDLSGKTDDLVGIVNSETKTVFDQIEAYQKLQGLYPKYLANMSRHEFQSMSLTEQQKLLNKALSEFDISNKDAILGKYRDMYAEIQRIKDSGNGYSYESALSKATDALDISFWTRLKMDGADVEELLQQHIRSLEEQKKQREENLKQAEFEALPEEKKREIYKKQLLDLEKQKALIESQIPNIEGINATWVKLNPTFAVLNNQLGNILSKIADTKNKLSDKPVSKNKSFWEKEKKDAEDALELMDETKRGTSEWKIQLDKLNTAKVKLGIWDFSGKSEKKAETESDKAKKLQQELNALQAKLSNEQLRQKLDFKQKEIDLDEEGFNKQLKQNALNYEKELQQIKEYEDEKAKEREEAILKFGKNKVPQNLSESNVKNQADAMKNNALLSFEKANKDTLKNLTDKYQSYADQRLEIEKKFNKDIEALQSQLPENMLADLKSKMLDLFGNGIGNVDLLARPMIDAAELVKKGWEDAGDGIATVFSSQFGISDSKGKEHEILVTPILPNGDVLSPDDLSNYVDNILSGSEDILKADNLGIVIGIDVKKDGSAGEVLHQLQEQMVNIKKDAPEVEEKIRKLIAKATADKGKGLLTFDFDLMKEAPEYIRAFEDLGTTSSETLNSLLGQFERFKEEAAKTLSPKELREYTATIQSIADELSNRDLYSSLIKQKDEAVKANQRLIKAENDLRLVKLGIGDPLLTEEEAIKRVNKAKDEYYNKNKKVLDTQKKIRDQISALAKEMSGLGNALGGTSGEIISFIGDITSFYTTASEGIEKVAQTGAQAISVVEKASVILTIISTAIQLMKQLNSILPDAFSQYEKYDEKIERINDMRDAVNEYEIAVLKASQAENSWFGNDSLRNLKDYKELQAKIFDSYRDKMLEGQAIYENKGSGGWLTNSLKSAVSWVSKITYGFDLLNKKYKEGTTAAVNNLRIETRKKSSGFLGSGIGGKSQKTEDLVTWTKKNLGFDLFDAEGWINKEAYDAIISKYGDKLVGQTKETLDELKGLRDQYDEYLNQLHEYVSSLYEPLIDNMVDSIWDWFDEGKDALDSFKDYAKQTFRDIVSDMIKTILLKDVFKDFKDNIAKLYEEYSKGNLTEAQLSEAVAKETNSVMDRYKTQLPAIQGMVDTINKNLKDTTGIDLNKSTSYSQSSSKGSYETITQDQAGAIDGRLTGIHEVDLLIEQNTFQLVLLSTESNQLIRGYKEEFMAIRNVLVESRFLWEEIRDSNNELYEIKDILQEIKKNTKGLITK